MKQINLNPSFNTKNNMGGKAGGLLFLQQQGFNIPGFYIIEGSRIDEFLNQGADLETFINDWIKENNISSENLWAVRSSGAEEDGSEKSFAGQFHTELNVSLNNLDSAVSMVYSSFKERQANNYSEEENQPFSIIVQKMVIPDYAGVVFSRNPINEEDKSVIVNVLPGIGDKLVSGEEEGFVITVSKRKIISDNSDRIFTGEVLNKKIEKTGRKIIRDLGPFLKSIKKSAKKLENKAGYPVDLEFAIENGKLFWLQIRPITGLQNQQEIVWDNTGIGENFPGLTLPLSISFIKNTYGIAYSSLISFLGMGKSRLKKMNFWLDNMIGEVYGAVYYNVTAWQNLLYQLPFGKRLVKHYTRIMGMEDTGFQPSRKGFAPLSYTRLIANIFYSFLFFNRLKNRYEKNYKYVFKEYNYKSFENKGHTELREMYFDMTRKFSVDWVAPVLNGLFAMLLLTGLRKMIRNGKMERDYPNFVNDILFAQGEVISVSIVRSFGDLMFNIQRDEDVLYLFRNKEPEEIYSRFKKEYPSLYSMINEYIKKYGERCEEGELKLETIDYKEEPLRFIAFIKRNLVGKYQIKDGTNNFDYRRIVKKYYRIRLIKRMLLLLIIKRTIARVKDRENYRFVRTKTYALYRALFRAIDKDLERNRIINAKGDSLFLELNDILDENRVSEFKDIIEERKHKYSNFKDFKHAGRYIQKGDRLFPVLSSDKLQVKDGLKGVGCCSGIVEGEVKIVSRENLLTGNFEGYILVAQNFEPGWINVFSKAAGIISEKGNLLSHTSILCRELGIPSIVGAKNILHMVKNGKRIWMNGATGEVKIVR